MSKRQASSSEIPVSINKNDDEKSHLESEEKRIRLSTTGNKTKNDSSTYSQITKTIIYVDVIVPVHNAALTIRETAISALKQTIPTHLKSKFDPYHLDIAVCCYDDGSKDESLSIMYEIKKERESREKGECKDEDDSDTITYTNGSFSSHLLIGSSHDGSSRGAGYARNQAVSLRAKPLTLKNLNQETLSSHYLCLLDSDDIMRPTRIAEQVSYFLSLDSQEDRDRTLLGTTFVRDPPDSTWHYANWANKLTDKRLHLEQFREVTILQPTWMMTKRRFQALGGYIEAPIPSLEKLETKTNIDEKNNSKDQPYKLIHPLYDTPQTLRLAEDLRFFHAHLNPFISSPEKNSKNKGILHMLRTPEPLLVYRHRLGMSQSASTPRKLLLQLRVKALEDAVLSSSPKSWDRFVIWGAGRDGKDFLKALSPAGRKRVICFVDVDWKKIETIKNYVNKELDVNIPILHFSELAKDPNVRKHWRTERQQMGTKDNKKGKEKLFFGRITKKKNELGSNPMTIPIASCVDMNDSKTVMVNNNGDTNTKDIPETSVLVHEKVIDGVPLSSLPVIVCVAMYRTNGALENNVASIGRKEGNDLWHFS